MKIAVRMDDITPDMNWENFSFFQELFAKAGITPLLGIVPDNRDPKLQCGPLEKDFFQRMKQLEQKGYSLAMHGCYHIYTTKRGGRFPLNNFSEFAGLPYEKQKELLAWGKKKLSEHGIDTDIFMAPAHSYDKNTLRALRELGFTGITDGFGRRPYRESGFTFYPISFLLERNLRQKEGVTTMVVHANTLTEADRERYRRIFREHEKDMISYSEYLGMEPVQRRLWGRWMEYGMAKFKFFMISIRNMRKGR